jgi:hypothetical protein
MKYPQKIEDFDESKGVEFAEGRWEGATIQAMKIFNNGLQVDTRISTLESDRIMQEAIDWAVSRFGIVYHPQMVSRKAYVSNLTFYTEVPILGSLDSPISRLAQHARQASLEIRKDGAPWEPITLTISSDVWPRKPIHAPFTIQRRADAAFAENKYFSEAPFPTDLHISMLEQFEMDVKKDG